MRASHWVIQATLLFIFWLSLSGHYDLFHIGAGLVSVALILWLNRFNSLHWLKLLKVRWSRAFSYPFFLLRNIVTANLQVAYLIVHPRLPIDPVILEFPTRLKSGFAKLVLGNSITLTPGTITIDIQGQNFQVHALARGLAESLVIAREQNHVAEIFGDPLEERVEVAWH